MWIKAAVFNERTISMYAYRNGNGGVTLGTCSKAAMYEWDFVLRNPGDIKRYQDLADAS